MNILTHIETRYDSTMTPYTTLTLRQDGYERQPEDYRQYLGQPVTISSGYTEATRPEVIWERRTLTYNNFDIDVQSDKVEMEFLE